MADHKRVLPRLRLVLGEQDYLYGTGPVTILVESFGETIEVEGVSWITVHGVEVFEHGSQARTLHVRLAAAHEAMS